MTNLRQRQLEVQSRVAQAAFDRPLMSSGFLFHGDVRDNFYYASYLFAASQDEEIPFAGDRVLAKSKAEGILQLLLELQDIQPDSQTYGHWPLNLRTAPQEAPKNTLPVELMGSLMVYFYERYAHVCNSKLRGDFEESLRHIYKSSFYRKPIEHYNHHEAKYTAAKLIYGQRYGDKELFDDGVESLRLTLDRVTSIGMSEYGGLPWFWHWVQAFTCAWQLVVNPEVKDELARMLDYLWRVRSTYYLGGAWVGPHARMWPHDMPKDTNVLHDYVQYGDFKLPADMPRTEYAGFLAYEAPADALDLAFNRETPVQVKSRIPKQAAVAVSAEDVLHSYVYITENFAMGGMYERVQEFDNEQHRWDVALPLGRVEGVNHAYFFHPGAGFAEGDLRHQSEYSEVFFHRNTIISLYHIPEDQPDRIIGCLPPGEWVEEEGSLFGLCANVYMAVFLQQPYEREVLADRVVVTSVGRTNAVVFECVDQSSAASKDIADLQQFAEVMKRKRPSLDDHGLTYTTLSDDLLVFQSGPCVEAARFVNGLASDFADYTVPLK